MSECDRQNGMFLFSLVRVICPPTFTAPLSSVWDYTGAPATNNVESADVYTRHTSADVSAEMRVWKLSQDVYTAAFDECLLVCQRAACLTSKTAPLLACVLFWHHPCYRLLLVAGSDVEPGKEYQRHSSDACWRCLTLISFKYLHYIRPQFYYRQKQLEF